MEEKRTVWQWLIYLFLVILGLIVVVLVIRALLINGTGFDATTTKTVTQATTKTQTTTTTTTVYQPGKTLWDWMQLLIIPFVIAVAGYVINLTISRSEQAAIEQRTKSERYAAEQRDKTERDLALDRQREVTLREYIDKMSELLLHENLRVSKSGDEVQTMARIRTALAISRLDGQRKRHVIDFLKNTQLIEANAIVDMRGVQLNGASLRDYNMRGLNLHGVNLSKAELSGADLRKTDLTYANLTDADLSNANLTNATVTPVQLAKAKSLQGATMPDGSIHP